MARLYKNARIVDIKNEKVFDGDILVENGKIKSLSKQKTFAGDVVDLHGDFVLPPFVNAFMDSVEAGKENFFVGDKIQMDSNKQKALSQLLLQKNLRAGAVFFNDIAKTRLSVVEKIEEKSEKELSALSMKIAKEKTRPYVFLGQDLLSLGSIDKQFGKSAVFVLEDFGFLDRNPVIVGGNCLEKDDLQTLKEYDCDFVVLPFEDGRLGRRQTNIVSLLKKGFQVSVGSGRCAEIDFFGFMRQMICEMRSLFEDPNVLSEKQALEIATNGTLLGFENCLEVGNGATFIVVSGRESLYDDIFKTLVWERSKNDVVLCVKDGEVLQKNGEIFMQNLPSCDTIIKNLKQ